MMVQEALAAGIASSAEMGNPTIRLLVTMSDLATLSRWVAWQQEDRSGGKPTKVPYSPSGCGKAKADDPGTWGTRAAAEARAVTLPRPYGSGGVGIELGDLYSNDIAIGGIDLDTCCEAGAPLAAWAVDVVRRFASYTETSPSGTGAKVFFHYRPSFLPKLRDEGLIGPTGYGRQFKRGGGEHPPAIELYLGNRYFAVTDQQLPDATPEVRRVSLDDLVWLLKVAGPSFARTKPDGGGRDDSRSAIAFANGIAMRRAGLSYDDMVSALRADPETADWVREKGLPYGERELRRIWDRGAQPDWLSRAQRNKEGNLRSNLANAILTLREAPELGEAFA
jgi:putative DNA primase/helicase